MWLLNVAGTPAVTFTLLDYEVDHYEAN